jgi:tetratricopeptide (TPR) repeat protein
VGRTEIEVRGTAFTVTASADQLTEVAVVRGRVEVKPEAGEPAVLVAGQSWHVAPIRVAASPAAAPSPSPPAGSPHRATVPAPRPLSRAGSPALRPGGTAEPRAAAEPSPAAAKPAIAEHNLEEQSYDQGWEALRANDFTRAANDFARVLLVAPDSPLVEDASYWRAVALARGKRSAEALAAFRDFLDGYAGSARAGEASAMLGWLLVDARAYDEAERRFRAAAAHRDPAVRASAGAGLDALARRLR